jgi:hypothetical protein
LNFAARATSRAFGASRVTSIVRSARRDAWTHFGGVDRIVRLAGRGPATHHGRRSKDLIEQLQNDAAGIDQQYTGVKEQIKQGRVQPRLKRADVKAQTDKVAQIRLQVGQVALAQFQNRNLDTAAQLFVTRTPRDSLARSPLGQKATENQNSSLQDCQQAQANLVALEHSSETDLATLSRRKSSSSPSPIPRTRRSPRPRRCWPNSPPPSGSRSLTRRKGDGAGVPASLAQPDQWQRQGSQSASVRESAARGALRAQ